MIEPITTNVLVSPSPPVTGIITLNQLLIADSVIFSPQNVSAADRKCMAEAIYFEARGESEAGQLAVGLVIDNRLARLDFPKTICGVVHDGPVSKKGVPFRNKCQFSYYCDGKSDTVRDQKAWELAEYYTDAILGGRVVDFTGGATHYHTRSVKTNWGFPLVAEIDNHLFYRKNTR